MARCHIYIITDISFNYDNNTSASVYGAVIMELPLRWFTQFMW